MSPPGATVFLDMVGVAWAAIGLLAATLLGTLYWLGSRIDAQAARIDELTRQVAQQGAQIAILTERVEALTARVDDHLGRHAG